jgi:hypothetical protein
VIILFLFFLHRNLARTIAIERSTPLTEDGRWSQIHHIGQTATLRLLEWLTKELNGGNLQCKHVQNYA